MPQFEAVSRKFEPFATPVPPIETLKEKPKYRLDAYARLCPRQDAASAFLSLATSSLTWITAAANAEQRPPASCAPGR
jgi:hypothetical protein